MGQSGMGAEEFELYVRDERQVVIFAHITEDGLYAIFMGRPMQELPQMKWDQQKVIG